MSGKTFDYERAWHEVAAPAFMALPVNVRALYARVTAECSDLHQLRDLSMPWPEGSDLRAEFDAVPSDDLALASRVIFFAGHWRPSSAYLVPAVHATIGKSGESWKFAHYADQVLRGRLGLLESGAGSDGGLKVIEGAIRVCYSSRHMWTWEEVAPATDEGLKVARGHLNRIMAAVSVFPGRNQSQRDSAAYAVMESLKKADLDWPGAWGPLMRTDVYMVDESTITPDRFASDDERQAKRIAGRAKCAADFDAKIESATRKLTIDKTAKLWLWDHHLEGLIGNCIYYDHTDRFCFGWYQPLGADILSRLLDVVSEFPYNYDIKGYVPEPVKP